MQTQHFDIRSRQRFGRQLKKREIKQFISLIKKNRLKGKYDNKKGTWTYEISWDNKPCQIIYNAIDEVLVTFYIYNDFRQ